MAILTTVGCDEGSAGSDGGATQQAEGPAPRPTKSELQAKAIATASAEIKAGNREPAIAAYLKAEKFGPLPAVDAQAFAAALHANGDALVTRGELRRALANYTKAIAVAPEGHDAARALTAWLKKWDEEHELYAEDALATSLEEDLPGELAPAMKAAVAGAYIEHAKLLAEAGREPARAAKVFELARTMDPKHADLQAALDDAEPKLVEQIRAATRIDAAVADYLAKHPAKDGIGVIAKRTKSDPEQVRAAVETMAIARQDLLDKLEGTRWGVLADVEVVGVRRTSLGDHTAEFKLVVTGCDRADHPMLARAALDGLVEKLPAGVDSLRAPVAYKGLACGLSAAGFVGTWRRGMEASLVRD